jgi:formamidopyrimidine-DNA glycosylase
MPELPEVQTVVDELQQRLAGRCFGPGATFNLARTAGYPAAETFATRLAGRCVTGARRRGKYILIDLDNGQLLVIHLRMTGNLHFAPSSAPASPYLRARLPLADGEELRFADMRTFGRLYLGTADELATVIPLQQLGPEPLEEAFTLETLGARLAGRRGAIKPALLDQRVLAGLGNIYADEALFLAKIDPRRPANSLTDADLASLYAAIQTVLAGALANGGTSFRNYLSTWGRKGTNQEQLQVFRRQGAACPRCGTPLIRIVVGGRGTHLCPTCQR